MFTFRDPWSHKKGHTATFFVLTRSCDNVMQSFSYNILTFQQKHAIQVSASWLSLPDSQDYKLILFSLSVLKQSKDLKNEMSPLVDSFLIDIKKKVEALSKRHRKDRCHVMRLERERQQQAGYAVIKYYQVLSLRDIRQQWSHRPLSVKSVASSLNGKNSNNPTLWPFTAAPKPLSPNVTPSWKPRSLPLKRKQGYDLPVAPVTLEPNVRVIDETSL